MTEQTMSRAAWLYFAIECTLTSAAVQPEHVDEALRELADDLWLQMSSDERRDADARAAALSISAPRSLGMVDRDVGLGLSLRPRFSIVPNVDSLMCLWRELETRGRSGRPPTCVELLSWADTLNRALIKERHRS